MTRWMTPKEAACLLGYSQHTLKKWRQGRKRWEPGMRGPRFKSVHGRIFYDVEVLMCWLEQFSDDYHPFPDR